MTTADVKAILNETTTTYDDYFDANVPLIEEWTMDYCNNYTLTGGMQLFVARAAKYQLNNAGVQSESLGDYSVTYGTGTNYPPELLSLLQGSVKLRFA